MRKRRTLRKIRNELKTSNVLQERYNTLDDTDKKILTRYITHYRQCNNAVWLAHKVNYSPRGVEYRLKLICDVLNGNTNEEGETID